MDFHFTEYQATVESAVSALADRFRAVPVHQAAFQIYSAELDREVEAAPDGFAQQRRVGNAADIAIGFLGQGSSSLLWRTYLITGPAIAARPVFSIILHL